MARAKKGGKTVSYNKTTKPVKGNKINKSNHSMNPG